MLRKQNAVMEKFKEYLPQLTEEELEKVLIHGNELLEKNQNRKKIMKRMTEILPELSDTEHDKILHFAEMLIVSGKGIKS